MEERPTMETVSGTVPELAQALAERYELLSPSQRRAIDLLLTDTRVASFVSARELAQQAGVSTSIVTRAAQTLGFAGYPELQTRLREQLLSAMPRRIESTIADLGETPETAAMRIMEEDIEGIRQVLESCSLEALREGVDLLVSARRVYIFGARGSFGLAHILCTALRLTHPEVHLLSQAAGDLADQLVLLREGDALVVIGFRRLDHFTEQVVRHSVQKGVRLVGITDHPSCIVARLAEVAYITPSRSLRVLPPFAAAASLINALVTAVSLRNRRVAEVRYREAEELRAGLDGFETT